MKPTTLLLKTLSEAQQALAEPGSDRLSLVEKSLEIVGRACAADRVSVFKWSEPEQMDHLVAQFTADGVERHSLASEELGGLAELGLRSESDQAVPVFCENRLVGAFLIEFGPATAGSSFGSSFGSLSRSIAIGMAKLLAPFLDGDALFADLKLSEPVKDQSPSLEHGPHPDRSPPPDGALHILIVEDNAANLFMIEKFIEKFGAVAHIARNGQDALARCRERVFDVILMDLNMPKLDGFDATREIVTGDGPNRQTPIVAVTADVTAGIERRCRKIGIQHYIAKPLRRDTLIQVLSELTNRNHLSQGPK
jgi:CheY-like chemotaxis protein